MIDPSQSNIDRLVDDVVKRPKYQQITIDLIRYVGTQELLKRDSYKTALKETLTKLHQIGGAYLNSKIDYTEWLKRFSNLTNSSEIELKDVCLQMMLLHASTKERIPIIDSVFNDSLSQIGPIHSILDLACGLNPLTIPWMPLASDCVYYACDIFTDMMDFLNGFFKQCSLDGNAFCCNLAQGIPPQKVQLALLLKTLPCLDQLDKHIVPQILENINADYLLVSYPLYSIGGKQKGMLSTYKNHFAQIIKDSRWNAQEFLFQTELVYLLSSKDA